MLEVKDLILAELRKQPLHRHDLNDMFDLDFGQLNNALTQLKKYGLIATCKNDLNNSANSRRWYKTDKTETYLECMQLSRSRSTKHLLLNSHKSIEVYSPYANPDMCVTSNDHHTTSNKTKVSAWSGYSSMSMM